MRPLCLLLAAALVSGILALPAFAQPQDCPTATPWASASLILPHPGESIHPGDIITAESLSGECYGAVTQGEARTALALHFPTPEDIHRPEIAVRIYRDGDVVRTLRTGLLPQRNDILDVSPALRYVERGDSLEAEILAYVELLEDAAAQIETLRQERDHAVGALASETARADAAEERAEAAEAQVIERDLIINRVWQLVGGNNSALGRAVAQVVAALAAGGTGDTNPGRLSPVLD